MSVVDIGWMKQHLENASLFFFPGETRKMHMEGCQSMLATINLAPVEISSAFQEARNRYPDLILLESDPIQFLRSHDFNGEAAAYRLMEYWKLRRTLFADNAYLSISLSPDGAAIQPNGRSMLMSGAAVILPRDRDGRQVVLIDRSVASISNIEPNLIDKVVFLILQALSQHEISQIYGIVVVDLLSTTFHNGVLDLEKLIKPFPVSIHALYLVQNISKIDESLFLYDVLPQYPLKERFREITIPVSAPTQIELLAKLEQLRFIQSGLPTAVGGSWSLRTWIKSLVQAHEFSVDSKESGLIESPFDIRRSTATTALVELSNFGNNEIGVHAINQVSDSLALLPEYEKSAFLTALSRSPNIVKMESDPIRFLVCEHYDSWAAAKRIAAYWNKRLSIFRDRAFLPLNLSGSGALSNEDVMIFKSCYLVQLPDAQNEQSVICFNCALEPQSASLESQWRALFYLSHICSQNMATLRKGVIAINIFPPLMTDPPAMIFGALDLWESTLPHRINSLHLFCMKPCSTLALRSIYRYVRLYRSKILHVHVPDSGLDVLETLAPYGVAASGLPESIGGMWPCSNGVTWTEKDYNVAAENASNCDDLGSNTLGPLKKRKKVSPATSADALNESTDDAESLKNVLVERPSNVRLEVVVNQEDFIETNQVTINGLEQMEQAISFLSDEEKADLLLTRRLYPALVENESSMLRFLRFEKYNSWAAARRLAVYWKNRKRVFGERWCLPMNQTGEGALTRDDVTSLSTGWIVFLPNDRQNKSVLVYDSSRRVNHSRESRFRVSFYFWHVLCENEVSQKKGYKSLIVLSRPTLDRTMKECIALVQESFPTISDDIHLVNCPSISNKSSFLNSMVPLMMQLMGPFLEKNTKVHVADSRAELAEKLIACGFDRISLPTCVGGSWSYEMFTQWQESRVRYEWDLPSGSVSQGQPHIPNYAPKPFHDLSGEEKVERKRRMNVVHSRRRRERERIEMEVFTEQVADLREKNMGLVQENKKLSEILYDARCKISRMEPAPNSILRGSNSSLFSFSRGLSKFSNSSCGSCYHESLELSSPRLDVSGNSNILSDRQRSQFCMKEDNKGSVAMSEAMREDPNHVVHGSVLLPSSASFETSFFNQKNLLDNASQQVLNERHQQQLTARMLQLSMLQEQSSGVQKSGILAEQLLADRYHQQRRERQREQSEYRQGFVSSFLGLPWFPP